jgi:microcystin-dependent protein
MAQPYIGEIRMFAGNYEPLGWMFCKGQLLPISENDTLFVLLGTTYGGDGQETFALPNLQSRFPIHMGAGPGLTSRLISETGGSEEVTLTVQQLPSHTHQALANSAGSSDSPNGNVWATAGGAILPYGAGPGNATMNAASLGLAGGNQPHDNMIPYLGINFIISLFGFFPPQN